jgi:hypothetical protein
MNVSPWSFSKKGFLPGAKRRKPVERKREVNDLYRKLPREEKGKKGGSMSFAFHY